MDFVVMAALVGFSLLMLTLSYNIACQWQVNLRSRMVKLPEEMCLLLDSMKLQCVLPVWHMASHNEDCQSTNSLSFKEGMGKTDGEGAERTWVVLNPAGYGTKDAGQGQQADTPEDQIDNHNWLKNVDQGTWAEPGAICDTNIIEGMALRQKLIIALEEHETQIHVFEIVNETVCKGSYTYFSYSLATSHMYGHHLIIIISYHKPHCSNAFPALLEA
jgi:hypothetical protein